ncbi:nickel-dependent lactate racemase [Anaerosolibacter carboniphilus]|uniref:Nickel-dependent lactate racemase n=1 Tax=Anaerosolibacter carboniphilus TaxID=1417629 RepID=A0A841KPB9_9FIRM|nr:nickel-dependent lactate racemase [Anaerosolibacter carboniphilus]MBB6215263.1 nickel-dependent lactate racemase [Anaerosolibacter carboniphilus]
MNSIQLKYGKELIDVPLSEDQIFGIIKSNTADHHKTEEAVILDALENPIGSLKLREIVKPGEKVCIVISDVTRAWQRMNVYLPYLVDELCKGGITDENIIFISAVGSHRKQTEQEHQRLLGDALKDRFKVIDHDCLDDNNLVYLGHTSFGTPVKVNKIAMDCDHILLTGAIVFHLLAGWGGGKKSILPGIAGYETIMANHAMSLNPEIGKGSNPEIRSGKIIDNSIHADMLEAAALVKPSFIFNVIMDSQGRISHAVAGDYAKAHARGCQIVDDMDGIAIQSKAEMVIASACGYPKDINFYQTIKTVINAKEAVEENGVIIILSECSEGIGNAEIQEIVQNYSTLLDRERAIRTNYSIAKYIGYYATEVAAKHTFILVSSLPPETLTMANIKIVKTLEEALEMAYSIKGSNVKTYLMPHGANTLPKVQNL